jgi:anti-sigma B factor antagonist
VNLSVAIDSVDGVKVIHVGGELDVYTAPQLKEILTEALEGRDRFVLDLSQVQFIDSTGLGVLVSSKQRAQAASQDFHLVLDDPYLLKIFRITGFDGVFSIYPQVTDAIHSN